MVDASNGVELDAAATLLRLLVRRCDCCCCGCCWCFLGPALKPPPGERLDGEYRHTRPTARQREQTGRALEHLTLARKQPSQEARRRGWRGGTVVVAAREGGEWCCCFDVRAMAWVESENRTRKMVPGKEKYSKGSYTSNVWTEEVSRVLVGALYRKDSTDGLYRYIGSEAG